MPGFELATLLLPARAHLVRRQRGLRRVGSQLGASHFEASLALSALAFDFGPLPLELGTRDSALPMWSLLHPGGAIAGYVFESRELAPIPGFSGTPINLLVMIDPEGRFLDVRVLEHNEPVFVSGLGPGPLHAFVTQYGGKSPDLARSTP